MPRRHISRRKHSRKFNRAQKRTRGINRPTTVMRGGIRL